jgi:hypothetical protein
MRAAVESQVLCTELSGESSVTVPLAAKLHWGPIESDLDPSIFYCLFIDAGAGAE